MSDTTFDVSAGFEQGEVTGNVRLGRFEAQYEELFAEVIEDGVITAEERARLDRAADSLGLDKVRLRSLEIALQAAYEARHRVQIRDLSDTDEDDSPRGSLMPIEAPTDPRTLALQRKVAALEARVAELTRELEDARAHVAVEVDLSDVSAAPVVEAVDESPEVLQRRLRHDPRDERALHSLFRAWTAKGDVDRAFTTAEVLAQLGVATKEERSLHVQHRVAALIQPTTSISQEAWRRLLFHPDEEVLTGEIFSVIVSAVLLGRVSALRRDKLLPTLDPATKQDPAKSTVQAVRCFAWGASILGMRAPTLYADPSLAGIVEMVPGVPPCSRLGKLALSGRQPRELAFFAGRHLAWYREERFVRLLVPSIPDLEDLFLAALLIGNPGVPLTAEMKTRVTPIARASEPILEPILIDRLRGYFLRFVEEGGRTNLQRWASAADKTASRAGLVLSGDLAAAAAMLELESAPHARERLDDLFVFATSDRYAQLRRQIGVAVGG
ncbi:MAG: hypothetical protein IT374_28325 [Polyangiaceae bacterium]|nr:hypothetical protein [Polyangiaceae bacterium]